MRRHFYAVPDSTLARGGVWDPAYEQTVKDVYDEATRQASEAERQFCQLVNDEFRLEGDKKVKRIGE
ncbi:hypothetical protein CDD83_2506 [Cordyceps sp. RAO-2017]|nr:hypothetical protein CDD83_2506 [Cordyceps sp. RAO-2017]